MANYKNIAGHTIDISIVNKGKVIDLGCRDFEFARLMTEMGCKVDCYDADVNVKSDKYKLTNKAVTTYNGSLVYAPLGECGYTSDLKMFDNGVSVECIDFTNLSKTKYGVLKLDIEGSEYGILTDPRFKPLPKQITVEFHHHVFPEIHDKMYPKILENLSKWYDLVYQREDAPLMDCLFVRR